MRLVRGTDRAVVAAPLELARSFGARLRGLMFRRGLAPGAGLWLEPCDSIHMMFLPFSIDVAFVRRAGPSSLEAPGLLGEVVAVRERVRAWIGLAWCSGATGALELEAGAAARLGLAAGDPLVLEAA
jgi:uncharacterized membrane protein (UPF0127 family)